VSRYPFIFITITLNSSSMDTVTQGIVFQRGKNGIL
jgi:hypothetical protein